MKKLHKVLPIIMCFLITIFIAGCTPAPTSTEQETKDHQRKTVPDIEKDTPMEYSDPGMAEPMVFKDLVPFKEYKTNSIPPGNKASYDIDLKMEGDGTFHVDTKISVENKSNDNWDMVQFYFIPNAFTKENKPANMGYYSEIEISNIMVDGKSVSYSLDYDALEVKLRTPLANGEQTIIDVSYSFTVPTRGTRFSKINNNYYLAQFYPMLVTYNNGWNKVDYNPLGESYHTDFSDFIVTYEIPDGYTVYSTADEEGDETSTETLLMNGVKEFYMAIMKSSDMTSEQETVNGTEIRVIGYKQEKEISDVLATAVDSFQFFEENIGEYPHKQLDIIMDADGMEYPGIVTVGANDTFGSVTNIVVSHEIGHQWFYGAVSSDPYYDAWIDEGVNEFVNLIYFLESHKDAGEEYLEYSYDLYGAVASRTIAANLPLDEYDVGTYGPSVYLQPSLKLHELFSNYGGNEAALDFLQSYYEHYQYKEVDQEEFLNFLTAYLQLEDVSVFDEWLKIK